MDGFHVDSFNFEKPTVFARFRRLRSVARLFRLVEICAAMALLTWLCARAPLAVKVSGDYFRRLSAAVASPVFVFFVGNAIVVALFVKSGQLYRSATANVESEMYEKLRSELPEEEEKPAKKEIVFQDKEIICEETMKHRLPEKDSARVSCSEPTDLILYKRSQSENTERRRICNKILRRSHTDICRKQISAGKSSSDEESDDKMSNEEFRRTIEEFIAKQVRFRREESHSVVVQTHA